MAVLGVDLVVLDLRLQFLAHVADRVNVDQRGDEGHHEEHHRRQAVDGKAQLQDRGLLVVLQAGGRNRQPGEPAAPLRFQTGEVLLRLAQRLFQQLLLLGIALVMNLTPQMDDGVVELVVVFLVLSMARDVEDEAGQAEEEGQADGAGGNDGGRPARNGGEKVEDAFSPACVLVAPEQSPQAEQQQQRQKRRQRQHRGDDEEETRLLTEVQWHG